MTAYIKISTNGGSVFSDITPPAVGGAARQNGLASDVNNINHIAALVFGSDVVISPDKGTTWNVGESDLSNPISVKRWPYDSVTMFYLDDVSIRLSVDDGSSSVDKTGNWPQVMGVPFSDPVKIIPVWLV